MEFLIRPCLKCHNPMHGGVYRAAHVCPHCLFEHEGGKSKNRKRVATTVAPTRTAMQVEEIYEEETADIAPEPAVEPAPKRIAAVTLTTKSAGEHTLLETLEEVSADCVLNLKVTPDLIDNGKFVGTKSEKVRAALEQGKKHVLSQLRQKAQERGANIVTDVAVKNAVKATDTQSVKIVVKATGLAAVAEATAETSEV